MPLNAAHKGYLYQDLATAFYLAKAVIHNYSKLIVDKKDYENDRFDDLSIYKHVNYYTKYQFKYTQDPAQTLQQSDLTTERRDLRIDRLVEGFSIGSSSALEYRLCGTWLSPTDDLVHYLVPDNAEPSFDNISTRIYKLNCESIWPTSGPPKWICLEKNSNVTRESFIDFCSCFVIELEFPQASLDLSQPGPLELELFEVLEEGIGIGRYPNQHRNVVDVSAHLINLAAKARSANQTITKADIEKSLELRTDFGRVSQTFQTDKRLLVDRDAIYSRVLDELRDNSMVILTGEPGSGKSWIINRLCEELLTYGSIIAKHYCYLEPGDPEVQLRITTDVLFANLISELLDCLPVLRDVHRPIYSAGPRELERLLQHAVKLPAFNGIYLFVDGLDHISRVLSESRILSANEVDIVEQLYSLDIPDGVSLVLASQPGRHLRLFEEKATTVAVPPWTLKETKALVDHSGCTAAIVGAGMEDVVESFVTTIFERSEGNPLYITFLCRQLRSLISARTTLDIVSWAKGMPKLEGNISTYYDYLLRTADRESQLLSDFLGLIDFGLTETEIQDIFPMLRHHVQRWIQHLSPIIKQVTSQGGVRIYHESFRRFIVERLKNNGASIPDIMSPVIDWLSKRGFYVDARSYRFLLTCLRRAGRDEEVLDYVDKLFLSNSIAAGHPKKAVEANLILAVEVAGQHQNWPVLTRLSELYRGMQTCFEEKMYDLTFYGKTFSVIFGEDALAERLLFDGKPTYSSRDGLLLCQICDSAGVVPPWREYLEMYDKETSNGHSKDNSTIQDISVARFIGHLRTEGIRGIESSFLQWLQQCEEPDELYLGRLFENVLSNDGFELLKQVFENTLFPLAVRAIAGLFLARFLKALGNLELAKQLVSNVLSWHHRLSTAFLYKCYMISGEIPRRYVDHLDTSHLDIGLSGKYSSPKAEQLVEWVSAISVLAGVDGGKLDSLDPILKGKGWYRAWLRFVVELSRAEIQAGVEQASERVASALENLASEDNPFQGEPRACDLYNIHSVIHDTISRALRLLKIEHWQSALKQLVKISYHSTTYLQGSPGGPLTPLAVAEILMLYCTEPSINKWIVETMEELVRHGEKNGEFYETHAVYEMLLARAYAGANRKTDAILRWNSASVYLTGYGFHKDVAVFELIESIPTIGACDKQMAMGRLEKLHGIIDTIIDHTDGKETKHAHNYFFRALCSVDLIGAMFLISRSISQRGGRVDWRLERAGLDVLDELGAALDPMINFLLEWTFPFENDIKSLNRRLANVERIIARDRNVGELCFSILTAEVEGDRPKSDATVVSNLGQFATIHNLSLPQIEINSSPKDKVNDLLSLRSNSFVRSSIVMIPCTPIFLVKASPLDIMVGIRANRTPLLNRDQSDDDRMLNSFGYRVLELIQDDRQDEAFRLLHYFANEYRHFDGKHMADLADGFTRYGYLHAAAIALTLAYTRSTSHGGWLTLGGREHENCLKEAICLAPEVAYETLAGEVMSLIKDKGYVHGITRNLCEFFLRRGDSKVGLRIWDEAFSVIQHRVPGVEGAAGPLIPYLVSEVPDWGVFEAAVALLISRINHPEMKRKVSAVSGLVTLIRSMPESIAVPLKSSMSIDMPLTTTQIILDSLLCAESAPYAVSRVLEKELRLLQQADHYAVRYLSSRLLERIVQDPQVTVLPVHYSPSIVLPTIREQAILSLDWGKRVEFLSNVDTDFGSMVAMAFHDMYEKGINVHKPRIKSRYEASKNRVRDRYPATPFLFWEQEMFECVFHRILDELNFKVGLKDTLLQDVIPNLRAHINHWYSRSQRPKFEMPLQQKDELSEKIPVCTGQYEGWVRVGVCEEQLLLDGKVLKDVEGKVTIFGGLIFPENLRGRSLMGNKLPFGSGDINDWWETTPYGSVFGTYRVGPLVGLDMFKDVLGLKIFLLLPPRLTGELKLKPAPFPGPLEMLDTKGERAVVFRQWMLNPIGDDIDCEAPLIEGCDLIVRPDVYQELVHLCGQTPVFVSRVMRG